MLLFTIVTVLLCGSTIQGNPMVTLFYPDGFSEGTCNGQNSWTKWFNAGNPSSNGNLDKEEFSIIQQIGGNHVCSTPIAVHAESVSGVYGGMSYSYSWHTISGLFSALSSSTVGIDYQIRFCCANNQFIPTTTTTTTPRPITSTTCGRTRIPSALTRIFGGAHATANSWPWQVAYQESRPCSPNMLCYGNCGATILDAYHVLTAAHCISVTDPTKITLTAGIHDKRLSETNTRQVRTAQNIYIHQGWNRTNMQDDIAIVRVSQPFVFNNFVQPACLPGPDLKSDSDVVIIGWGAEAMNGGGYSVLKEARVKVIGNCNQFWGQVNTAKQVCVANRVSGDSACQGDSGGPILQQLNNQWIVQGVASFVSDCKTHGNLAPNVYVRVSAYLSWIRMYVK